MDQGGEQRDLSRTFTLSPSAHPVNTLYVLGHHVCVLCMETGEDTTAVASL